MSIDDATPDEWDNAASDAHCAAINANAELTPRDIERLNQILDRAFGELPLVARAYVFLLCQMGKVRVVYAGTQPILTYPCWRPDARYQVVAVETPKTKPSIDWSHIAPEYKWLARDSGGSPWVYENKPARHATQWRGVSGDCERVALLTSYVPGDCAWEDSLVERPTGV